VTTKMLSFFAPGIPITQGSKTPMGVKSGKCIMVESAKGLKPWREAVKYAAIAEKNPDWIPFTGPVKLSALFAFPRPKNHYKGNDPTRELKPGAPFYHYLSQKDLDKLLRAVFDALTQANVYRDDGQVAALEHVVKRYANQFRVGDNYADEDPGATIFLRGLE